MALDLNKDIPDKVNMGQYCVTKEEFLKMLKSGHPDLKYAQPYVENQVSKPSANIVEGKNTINLTATIQRLKNNFSRLLKYKSKYKYGVGESTKEVSRYEIAPVLFDEVSFFAWTLYELGAITSAQAATATDINSLLNSKALSRINVSAQSTVDDTGDYKLELLESAHLGDILVLDQNGKNDSVAFYLGAGRVYLLQEGLKDTSDTGESDIYYLNEDGYTLDKSALLDSFNGSIYRMHFLMDDMYQSLLGNQGI